jgi:hypothetical protein
MLVAVELKRAKHPLKIYMAWCHVGGRSSSCGRYLNMFDQADKYSRSAKDIVDIEEKPMFFFSGAFDVSYS